MKNFDDIAKDLFDKLRSRFPNIQLGDSQGMVTNVPEDARYFDFVYVDGKQKLGKLSAYIDEDDGLGILYSRDLMKNQPDSVRKQWYSFLRQMRTFAKKRLLNFDVRDITKTNLTQRDYQQLASKKNTSQMKESKLRGNAKKSYETIDQSLLIINHSKPIDEEKSGSRSRNILSLYIENNNGERFRYPHSHLNGARAMAQHVSQGGNPYDQVGKHILGLSEEMRKLKKFKSYTNRSRVMAESLREYQHIIQERIDEIRKTIKDLQKSEKYQQIIKNNSFSELEPVPENIKNNWIDQLTIKQFNEELADIFPYVYRLISHAQPQDIDLTKISEDYIDI